MPVLIVYSLCRFCRHSREERGFCKVQICLCELNAELFGDQIVYFIFNSPTQINTKVNKLRRDLCNHTSLFLKNANGNIIV